MKKVFLTGISGLLGTNLSIELLKSGFYVKGLIRNKAKYQGPAHNHLELIQGNIYDDLIPICSDCDYIIHAAAETGQNCILYEDYWETNYSATVQLFNTGIKCGVKRFIFISTANTLGYGSTGDPGSEKRRMRYPFSESFYARSKKEAEDYLILNKDKLDVVIVNPGFMLGAFDKKPGSGRIILMGLKKRMIFFPPGGKSFVHVKDVSQVIINSLEKGKSGEKYLAVNENLSFEEFFKRLNHITNQDPLMLKIPEEFLSVIGFLGDLLRFFNIKTNLSLVNMKTLCIDNFYSNQKSVTELGVDYTPVNKAISDAVDYFQKKKY